MTIDQVAKRLQVSKDTVERIIARKELRAKKVGSQWRIRELWLQAYMEDETPEEEVIEDKN